MRTYDLTPLFRSSIGFDRFNRIFDSAFSADENTLSYPPYNIARLDEHEYRITMAVAGFGDKDIEITLKESLLVVSGKAAEETEDAGVAYLHRGIARRAFERRFRLADHVKVVDAALADGLLSIELALEVPEAMKPRQISICTEKTEQPEVIEGEAA